MTHLVRITALIAVFAAAGCSVSLEVADTTPVAAQGYSDMVSAIPASQTPGNVFEYSSDVAEASPVVVKASRVDVQGNVFEYN